MLPVRTTRVYCNYQHLSGSACSRMWNLIIFHKLNCSMHSLHTLHGPVICGLTDSYVIIKYILTKCKLCSARFLSTEQHKLFSRLGENISQIQREQTKYCGIFYSSLHSYWVCAHQSCKIKAAASKISNVTFH